MTELIRAGVMTPEGKEYECYVPRGYTVWQVLELTGFDSGGSCGGQGICRRCRLRVEGRISEPNAVEKECLGPAELRAGVRLACHCRVEGEVTVYVDSMAANENKAELLQYYLEELSGDIVSCKRFFIPGQQKESPLSICDRIEAALPGYRLDLNIENLNQLAKIDRPGRPTLELFAVVTDEEKVLYIDRVQPKLYGLALDLGSTSLFAALVNLENGQVVAMVSNTNLQRVYGADIISRVSYCLENKDGLDILHHILINNLNSMINEMKTQASIETCDIYQITAVGNPVMLHFFLGLDVSGLGQAPYVGVFSGALQISANSTGLQVNPRAALLVLPQLGGFVGADTTACLLTLEDLNEPTFMLIDLGTNGEIVLGHQGKMWTVSAAAGPAFEGGAITCGTRALAGAIDRVYDIEGKLEFSVIGGGSPCGLCGSGIISLVAALWKEGYLDQEGAFTAKAWTNLNIKTGDAGPEIILVPGEEALKGSPIVFSQEDVRQVQLAKGAIRTGIDLLLAQANISAKQIQRFYLAGSFGSFLQPESLQAIGLIPVLNSSTVKHIGNAAARGAIMALLSREKVQEASQLKELVKYIELAEAANFQKMFLKNLRF